MSAGGLLARLRARGVLLSVAGDRLQVDAPPGVLTQDLREALAAHKGELLGLLAAEDGGRPSLPEASKHAAQRWDSMAARMLIVDVIRRAAAAWDATPPESRAERAVAALAGPRAALDGAYQQQDLAAVRRLVLAYEHAAAPIFAVHRESRYPGGAALMAAGPRRPSCGRGCRLRSKRHWSSSG